MIAFPEPDKFVTLVVTVIGPFSFSRFTPDDLAYGTAKIFVLIQMTGFGSSITHDLIIAEKILFRNALRGGRRRTEKGNSKQNACKNQCDLSHFFSLLQQI